MLLKMRYVSRAIYTDKVKGLLNILVWRAENVNYGVFGDGHIMFNTLEDSRRRHKLSLSWANLDWN